MKEVDVISKFLEAMRTGQTEEQAEFFARSWAEACQPHPEAATKTDLKIAVSGLQNEIRANFRIIYVLGTAIFASSCLPYLLKVLEK